MEHPVILYVVKTNNLEHYKERLVGYSKHPCKEDSRFQFTDNLSTEGTRICPVENPS